MDGNQWSRESANTAILDAVPVVSSRANFRLPEVNPQWRTLNCSDSSRDTGRNDSEQQDTWEM